MFAFKKSTFGTHLDHLKELSSSRVISTVVNSWKWFRIMVSELTSSSPPERGRPFQLLRYFSVISGMAFLVLTVAAVATYSHVRFATHIQELQRHNAQLARSVTNSISERFNKFLAEANSLDAASLSIRPEPEDMTPVVRLLIRDTGILKLKIYAPSGLTIYSTDFREIGNSKAGDQRFYEVEKGGVATSQTSWRSSFQAVYGLLEDRTLMETYVPIIGYDGQVKTITELYTDISGDMALIQEQTYRVALGMVSGLAILYFLLYLVVVRADWMITQQTRELTELSSELELRIDRRTADLKAANAQIEAMNADLEMRVESRTEALRKSQEDVRQLNVDLSHSLSELREAQEQIIKKGKLAQLGQLTATVAHEIRNPLGAIKTSAQLVERKIKNQGLGLEKALDRINTGIGRCDYIITELLDFARLKAVAPKKGDFDTWVRSIVEEERRNIPDLVTLDLDLQTGGKPVEFDGERLTRVLVNLLSNASEAMVGKGNNVATTAIPNPRILVSTRLTGGNVEIIVKDNGPGITQENMKKILEPLFTTKSFGVGLGLPAVEKILEQHGGGLRIESEPGDGATFTAWFPAANAVRNAA